jgi:hypothetical protein
VRRPRFLSTAILCGVIAGCGGGDDGGSAKTSPAGTPEATATGKREAFRKAFFSVGPYAFMLSVSRNNGLGLYSGRDLRAAGYRNVVDAIAAGVRAGMKNR